MALEKGRWVALTWNGLLVLGLALASAEDTSATGSDQTDLLTGRGVTTDGRGVTNVLMVTTTVRVTGEGENRDKERNE